MSFDPQSPTDNAIPIMDDPLGKYWEQPANVRHLLMDDTHVIISSLRGFHKYDRTMPTGVYPGKCWLRKEWNLARLFLCWYGAETEYGTCEIMFREVLMATDGASSASTTDAGQTPGLTTKDSPYDQ